LITPVPNNNALNAASRAFNVVHRRTRRVIECAIGMLKQRFRCLLNGLRVRSPAFACEIVRACVAMHNVLIAVDRPNYARENDEQDDDEQVNQGVPIVQA
jgi:hypothetical protein